MGDMSHNFTDGLAIAVTFSVDIKLGMSTTLAILIHEFPHEIGDFAILFKAGWGFFTIILFQLITACAALFGTYTGLKIGEFYGVEGVAFASGSFIYMSLCIFMEDLRHKSGIFSAIINIGAIGAGLFFMYCVAVLE